MHQCRRPYQSTRPALRSGTCSGPDMSLHVMARSAGLPARHRNTSHNMGAKEETKIIVELEMIRPILPYAKCAKEETKIIVELDVIRPILPYAKCAKEETKISVELDMIKPIFAVRKTRQGGKALS